MPATTDRIAEQLGAHELATLLQRAVTSGTITAPAADVLNILAIADAPDRIMAAGIARSEAATGKTRQRALARLRTCRWARALRSA